MRKVKRKELGCQVVGGFEGDGAVFIDTRFGTGSRCGHDGGDHYDARRSGRCLGQELGHSTVFLERRQVGPFCRKGLCDADAGGLHRFIRPPSSVADPFIRRSGVSPWSPLEISDLLSPFMSPFLV
jgi:hypothetical protein